MGRNGSIHSSQSVRRRMPVYVQILTRIATARFFLRQGLLSVWLVAVIAALSVGIASPSGIWLIIVELGCACTRPCQAFHDVILACSTGHAERMVRNREVCGSSVRLAF